MKTYFAQIKQKHWIAKNLFDVTIEQKDISKEALPGQFIMIKCADKQILRRPISICDTYDGLVRFVFEVRGEGTKWLAERKVSDIIDVFGPLGHGYSVSEKKSALLIGGGIGIFPLLMTAKSLQTADAVLGFRNYDAVVMNNDFKKVCRELFITTDDGSYGIHGLVTDKAKELLVQNKYDIIFACGPTPMLKAVKALADEYHIDCEISMEQRMGCGVGACLVCACKTKKDDSYSYSHVCKDGPVFSSKEVIFDD